MCILLTNGSSTVSPSHLPPLPLVIAHLDSTRTMARNGQDNIHLGLQNHDRVRRVVLRAASLSLRMWLEPMSGHFPRLRDLSLVSTTTEMPLSLVLPETFRAPDLRRLALHDVGLPRGISLLSSMIALSTLSLTGIQSTYYLPPRHLVIQLQGLVHLEDLTIGFAMPIPLSWDKGELLPAPIPPVTLPTLRRLAFRGVDVYLDNLVAQINTPLLERLSLTLIFDLSFTLVNLTEFIYRTEGLRFPVARVIFNKDGASINAGTYEELDMARLSLHINCKPLDWQIDSATQICSTLGNVFSAVEELTIDLEVDGMPPDWKNPLDDMLWHELLLPFIGVKKLHIGSSITLELSQALQSVSGGLVMELLPELKELEVLLKIDLAADALSKFMKTRESIGRPVQCDIPAPSGASADGDDSAGSDADVIDIIETVRIPTEWMNYVGETQKKHDRINHALKLGAKKMLSLFRSPQ